MHSTESDNDPVNLREVFEVLSGDLNACFEPVQQCLQDPDEDGNFSFEGSAARNYVSVAFACIASVSTCMRQWAVARMDPDEAGRYLHEQEDVLSDGQVMTPLEKAVRIGFGLLDRVYGVESQSQPNDEQWWRSLRWAIATKYRLTSPAAAADLEISADELMTVIDAEVGFRLRMAAYLEEPAISPQLQFTGE
jgi:hypothetical protein